MSFPLWCLSFCDASRPKGQHLLGVSFVEATEFIDAITVAHARGCNPGGEVQGMGPVLVDDAFRPFLHKLLTREEAEAADRVLGPLLIATARGIG